LKKKNNNSNSNNKKKRINIFYIYIKKRENIYFNVKYIKEKINI
jgi:hypothetical protein